MISTVLDLESLGIDYMYPIQSRVKKWNNLRFLALESKSSMIQTLPIFGSYLDNYYLGKYVIKRFD